MTILTMATSKGGAGKTTIAQIIIGASCRFGLSVGAIDSDLNHSLYDWVKTFGIYDVEIACELDESRIAGQAEKLTSRKDVVVIDTAGAALQSTIFAIGIADMVLIPVQMSSADVVEGLKTMRLVQSAAKMTKRDIDVRIVLTDYQPYTNIASHTESQMVMNAMPVMKTRLRRLVGFKEMTFNGEVPVHGPAGEQVRRLMAELMHLGAMPRPKQLRAS